MPEEKDTQKVPAKAAPSTKDFRILVVDDEEELVRAIAQLVAKKGYRAAMTTSGQSAIRQYAKQPFDLVLADLAMPDMNGWQVLEKLKGLKQPPKVVIMTGYVPQEGESILFDRKADGYLVKPISAERLDATLRALLFKHNLGRPAEAVAIDDDPSVLTVVQKALTQRGVFVTTFTQGHQAMQHIKKTPPDLVISDLNMPTMDGFEVARQIRSHPDSNAVPILILTADPSRENVAKAIKLGVNGFLAKPFDHKGLVAKVFQMLGRQEPEAK
jgi:CheY-like chemotaxis protein